MHVLITDAYISSVFLDYCDSIYKYYWMLINVFFMYLFVRWVVGVWEQFVLLKIWHTFHIFLALTVSIRLVFCHSLLVLAFSILIVSSITPFHFPCHFLPSIDSNLGISHFSDRRLLFCSASALCHLTALFFHIYFCLPPIKTLHKALFPHLI